MNDQHTTSADSFISHLVELRRRVIRALLAVALVFLGLVGWAADIFRWLARPLLMNLPKDGKMIVTDVTGSFFVPVKVTLLLALVIALPFVLYQLWALSRRACTGMRESGLRRWSGAAMPCFWRAWRLRILSCFRRCFASWRITTRR